MKCTRQNFFVILGHFLPFYPRPHFLPFSLLTVPKMKISKIKNEKIPGGIIILHKCTENLDHMLYCSWHMACDRCNYFSFGAIFCPFTPLTAQKMKISKKMKKTPLEISSFYTCVPKIMIRWPMVPELWCATDGRTDRQKKWHIEVGAHLKKEN